MGYIIECCLVRVLLAQPRPRSNSPYNALLMYSVGAHGPPTHPWTSSLNNPATARLLLWDSNVRSLYPNTTPSTVESQRVASYRWQQQPRRPHTLTMHNTCREHTFLRVVPFSYSSPKIPPKASLHDEVHARVILIHIVQMCHIQAVAHVHVDIDLHGLTL